MHTRSKSSPASHVDTAPKSAVPGISFRIPDPVREDGYNGTSRRGSGKRDSAESRDGRNSRHSSRRHGSDSSDSHRSTRDRHSSSGSRTVHRGDSRSDVSTEGSGQRRRKDYEERPRDRGDRVKDSDSSRRSGERHAQDREGIVGFVITRGAYYQRW